MANTSVHIPKDLLEKLDRLARESGRRLGPSTKRRRLFEGEYRR